MRSAVESSKLPQTLFTPSTKAALGSHDENVRFEQIAAVIGADLADQVRETSLRLYREAADYALAWLAERSLLSDAQFAESVVRSYTRRGYGAARIRQELQRRGISREDADAAMDSFSPALPQMLSVLEKRLHGDLSDRKEVDKAVAALQRRGFSWGDIKNALEEYGASLEIDE